MMSMIFLVCLTHVHMIIIIHHRLLSKQNDTKLSLSPQSECFDDGLDLFGEYVCSVPFQRIVFINLDKNRFEGKNTDLIEHE